MQYSETIPTNRALHQVDPLLALVGSVGRDDVGLLFVSKASRQVELPSSRCASERDLRAAQPHDTLVHKGARRKALQKFEWQVRIRWRAGGR
jgi:hypothetical protein